MLTHVARGFNDKDAGPGLKQIALTMMKHTDLHFGDCKIGNKYQMDPAEIVEKLTVGCQGVFKDKESLIACIKEPKEKDQGISIVVSGLFDEIFDCCHQAGIKPPLIEFALGVHGNTQKLWPPEILDFVTMCGHGLVSGRLVKKWLKTSRRARSRWKKRPSSWPRPVCAGYSIPTGQKSFFEKWWLRLFKRVEAVGR